MYGIFMAGRLVAVIDRLLLTALLISCASLGAMSSVLEELHFTVDPRDTVAVSGRPAILDCKAQYKDTEPEIRWKKGDTFITLDRRRRQLDNGSLYFEEIEHSRPHQPDQGEYQCVASVKDVGSIVSVKAALTVAYLEKIFQEEPQNLTIHLGDMAMFACRIGGVPTPTIRWFRDEMEIDSSKVNYHIHDSGVLEIPSVQFSQLGRYKCKAENVDRSRTSRAAFLLQNTDTSTYESVPPRFVMIPRDTVAVEGTSVLLFCGANGHDRFDRPPTISWLKDGVTIDMSDLDTRFTVEGQGSLRIDALSPEDSGAYTCRATNEEDSIDAVAMLSVHVAPRFLKRPKTVVTQVNSDVEFECEVDGIPRPRITWLHNGDVITPTNYFQITGGHNLKILGVIPSDAGMYQCFAENEVSSIEASAQMMMMESDSKPPTFLSVLPSNLGNRNYTGEQSASPDELPSTPRSLQVKIVSTRFITLSWQPPLRSGTSDIQNYVVYFKENGSNRERAQNTTQLEANIQHLKPGARYTFRVVAYNKAGPSPQAAEVKVETRAELSVPGPPRDLTVVPLSPHSMKIEWSPPAMATDITTYKLYYYELGAPEQHDLNTELSTSYILTGLTGYTRYSFRVLAYNQNGAGVSTDEVIARTYSGKPTAPPTNVTAEATSSTSIEVHWEPPPPEDCNGIITGYKLRYRERQEKASTITTDGNRRDYVITNLRPKTSYQIRVQAMTQNGTGPPSEWINADTLETDLEEKTVPGTPRAIHVRPMTDSILISWTPPAEQDIMIRGYTLGYGINVPDLYKLVLKAKQRYYTIRNLVPNSNYVISLRAFNNVGEGVPIYETATTRRATTPEPLTPMDPPLGLKAVVLTAKSVLLTWTDISLGDSQRINDNRYYTIAYNPKTSHKRKYINSTDLNAHIEDLKPDTEYEFSVKVIKGRRSSPPSMSIFVRTHEAEPATTPRDLTPVGYPGQPKWVKLSWQPPRVPNGQLTGYMVYYTTDSSLSDDHWVQYRLPGDVLNTVIRDLSLETTYYFKVQAKNSKGYGPPSPTVLYRTPRADGRGGGMLELPDDYGKAGDRSHPYRPGGSYDYHPEVAIGYDPRHLPPNSRTSSDDTDKGGLSPMVMWIIIGSISGVTVIVVITVVVIMCRRRMTDADRKKKRGPGYKPANKSPKDLKPPDLWIDQMELKSMDKGGTRETTASVSPLPRDGTDSGKMVDGDGSGERNYETAGSEERYQRTPIRPKTTKPIMIPVDQPPPPREPIATAVPNGHVTGPEGTVNPTPIRPVYPRTQYTSQYTSTPRVNAGDVTAPPPDGIDASTLERRKARADRMRKQSNSNPRLTVRPQPQQPQSSSQTSPYKNKVGGAVSQGQLARSPLPVVTPRAPDVTRCGSKDDSSDYGPGPKSVSTEDLTAQMANLEGLMKDLNAITQQEFEC